MRRTLLIGGVALLLAAGLAGGYLYWQWLHSPRYALQQMVVALKQRDVDTLFNYLDIQAIIDNFGQAASEDLAALRPETPPADEIERFGRRLMEKVIRAIPPKVVEALKPQIKAGVGKFLENLSTAQIVGLAAAATTAAIDTRGEMATVTLEDPKTRDKFRFTMTRDPKDGIWRISGVQYQDFKRFLKQEFQ
jgi:hypothetical protein